MTFNIFPIIFLILVFNQTISAQQNDIKSICDTLPSTIEIAPGHAARLIGKKIGHEIIEPKGDSIRFILSIESYDYKIVKLRYDDYVIQDSINLPIDEGCYKICCFTLFDFNIHKEETNKEPILVEVELHNDKRCIVGNFELPPMSLRGTIHVNYNIIEEEEEEIKNDNDPFSNIKSQEVQFDYSNPMLNIILH